MPGPTIKTFVSSTYEDLKDHRAHVIRALGRSGIFVDPMENWTATSDEPKRFSQQRLDGCHFCVLLVGFRRGYVPQGETASITQLEYEAALARGVDVLPYLLAEGTPWPARFDELKSDPGVRAWRRHLESKHGRELFDEKPESIDVAPAVTRWVMEHAHPVVSDMTGLAAELAGHEAVLRRRRNDVVQYLQDAQTLIEHAHDELAQGREPFGTCQQIFDTGDLLVRAIGDAVSAAELARLQELLRGAFKVEMLHGALQSQEERDLNLAALDRTRGSFAALVKAIGASPVSAPLG
ncbi:MAG: DUF4062 domain-containing protein [Acidobacteriota bacterium]|nr:DUF4062 domain-containing protein [Acidobacteriota bacterium]MDH3523504.1 DUF4062 domain-containing protein [Acidobacteriota bacterium]